jgi:hypothetical protein
MLSQLMALHFEVFWPPDLEHQANSQVCKYDAENVFDLPNSHDQELIHRDPVEIQKQSTPEEAA